MTLEKQVTSLELSKRLKELGVKQESLFYWYGSSYSGVYFIGHPSEIELGLSKQFSDETITYSKDHSAFTVAELGEMLPPRKEENGFIVFYQSHKNMKDWGWTSKVMRVDARNPKEDNQHFAVEQAATEADARAKMLIYLLENKLITL